MMPVRRTVSVQVWDLVWEQFQRRVDGRVWDQVNPRIVWPVSSRVDEARRRVFDQVMRWRR